jgi:hypothetical protein
VKSQDGKSSLFYRLDKDLGDVKIPVTLHTGSMEEKLLPKTEWQELSLAEGSFGEVEFLESSFLLEYSEIRPMP